MVTTSNEGTLKLVIITGEIMFEQEDQLDMYVLVQTPQQKGQTKTLAGKSKQNPPKWNQAFEMVVNQNVDTLTLIMFDEDVDEDHEFGSASIQMSELMSEETLD